MYMYIITFVFYFTVTDNSSQDSTLEIHVPGPRSAPVVDQDESTELFPTSPAEADDSEDEEEEEEEDKEDGDSFVPDRGTTYFNTCIH